MWFRNVDLNVGAGIVPPTIHLREEVMESIYLIGEKGEGGKHEDNVEPAPTYDGIHLFNR